MNEGLAALYAGLGALIGAVFAAIASYLAARHTADKSANALMAQVTQQTRDGHAHWVREQRRLAFANTTRAYGELANTMAVFRSRLGEETALTELEATAMEQFRLLWVTAHSTIMFGPPEAFDAAMDLAKAARDSVTAHQEVAFLSRQGGAPSLPGARQRMTETGVTVGERHAHYSTICRQTLLQGLD